MDSSLTPANLAALAGVLVVGASVPSLSVLTVAARSAALGFRHGALASVEIVVGDLVFILIAIYGLTALAAVMGSHFVLIKYLGGAYLIWLGFVLWRSRPKADDESGKRGASSSFMTGLLTTLGDQKAILFYLGFFPAFIELSALSLADTGIILAVAMVAVGAPKLFYALLAERAGRTFRNSTAVSAINVIAGLVMMTVGAFLIVKM